MSYREAKVIVTIITGLLVMVIYGIYAVSGYQNGTIGFEDLPAWATMMLIFIGVGIISTIVIQITFHVVYSVIIAIKEKANNPEMTDEELERIIKLNMVTDEMDKLVELKSLRVGFVVTGIGFISGLACILLGYTAAVLLNIIFVSFGIGSMVEGLVQLYYYKRGIRHG